MLIARWWDAALCTYVRACMHACTFYLSSDNMSTKHRMIVDKHRHARFASCHEWAERRMRNGCATCVGVWEGGEGRENPSWIHIVNNILPLQTSLQDREQNSRYRIAQRGSADWSPTTPRAFTPGMCACISVSVPWTGLSWICHCGRYEIINTSHMC